LEKVRLVWPAAVVEEFERTNQGFELFFAKDVLMNDFHELNGFALDRYGQGCFMLCARRLGKVHCDVAISNVSSPDELKDVEPCGSILLLNNAWEFTLVLPGTLEDSPFSRQIHDYLIQVIFGSCSAELAHYH
jgi:hypothetical protein